MPPDHVADDEWLYCSVRQSEIIRDSDRRPVRVSSQAFGDRGQEVSVDRARLRNEDPSHAQRSQTDAVAQLLTAEVRAIRTLAQRDEHGHESGVYSIDVRPDPLPENPAHAVIFADPRFASRSLFRKLQERLAYMAVFVLMPEAER